MLSRDQIVARITAIMPFTGPATFYSRQADENGLADDSYDSYSLQKVRPRQLDKKTVAANPAILQIAEKVFELYRNDMDAAPEGAMPEPRVDDYLVVPANKDSGGNGVVWWVNMVTGALDGGVFNLYCSRSKASA